MKTKLITLWSLCLFLASCSVSEVLKMNDDLNVILLETVELPVKHVGDTIRFKVFASTNDFIERMELTNATHDFSKMMLESGIRYEILDDTIFMDENGYFSRPVSSIVVNYPIIVGRELLQQVVGMDFTFHTNKGVSASTRAQMKVINMMDYTEKKDVYGFLQETKKPASEMESPTDTIKLLLSGTPFYSSELHSVYSIGNLSEEPEDDGKPHGAELVDYIDVFQYIDIENDSVCHFYSPDNIEVQKIVNRFNLPYDYRQMRHTRFVNLGSEFDYKNAEDAQIEALDFSSATDIVKFTYDDNIAFLTEDGRKGIMHITGFDRPTGMTTPVVVTKVQTIVLE